MCPYVVDLAEVDRSQVAAVGGKAAQLGELARIDGAGVPVGFCVTADAFAQMTTALPAVDDQLQRLTDMDPAEPESLRTVSAEIRRSIEGVVIPHTVAADITASVARLGDVAYAVRSSATAEDLPTASFAGQQDSYLNVLGTASILEHVRRCWASLFTERAMSYRIRNGFDHRSVAMAVVVQQMVDADAAGVLFTADPVTSNRKVALVEATYGLGEALVSGLISGDVYRVRGGEVVSKEIATKRVAVQAPGQGGTEQRPVEPERQTQPVLTDPQVVELAELGRLIEAHFGRPQDIEWCLADDRFHIVQSRPITTLFPIPQADDDTNHVYVSVGHGQMMTEAMRPLGISMWLLTSRAPMREAGGRLFVDVTARLSAPATRAALIAVMGRGDPLIGDALETVLARDGFIPTLPDDTSAEPATDGPPPIETDPTIVSGLIKRNQESVAELRRRILTKSGVELLDFILTDLDELRRLLFDPLNHQAVMAGMEATWWLNDQLESWLGERNAADTLTRSAPNNITSQMGLDLLDVADVIRPHPEVVAFLEHIDIKHEGDFLEKLTAIPGGQPARDAIVAYLERYGMRCVGEMDMTRTRWAENPTALIPALVGNLEDFPPGEATRRIEQGNQEAAAKEQELLDRLRRLPDGEDKAAQTKQMIDRVRTFIGYREYPKYGMVSRYFIYKQALLDEADRLVRAGGIGAREDIFYLSFDELREAVRSGLPDTALIRERKAAFESFRSLSPPRVLTSDGEVIMGAYQHEGLPDGALVGLAVSAGKVEGRARVVQDVSDADLEPGDILVTTHTDPSWTPLFVRISGLVTEVGGLMTHGSVIAREYGLTCVVGVEHATELIGDGQWIRVNGTDGYVELVADERARGTQVEGGPDQRDGRRPGPLPSPVDLDGRPA
jgi:phosphoenolpyruvate synthase/pyruvate phosphate dikinase